MLKDFPKERPSLPPEYQKIYEAHFRENREGRSRVSSVSRRLETWMHRAVAGDVAEIDPGIEVPTLEIGAGTLNHIPYERQIHPYDIVEPNTKLFRESPEFSRVRHAYDNIFAVEGEKLYRRIISIAVLEHLTDLPRVIARAGLLLNSEGSLRAGIPNEGTGLWRLGYLLTTGLEFRLRYGLDYCKIMLHEHVNTADEIEDVLHSFFDTVECKVLGLSKSVAFYRFYACQGPKRRECRSFLTERTLIC